MKYSRFLFECLLPPKLDLPKNITLTPCLSIGILAQKSCHDSSSRNLVYWSLWSLERRKERTVMLSLLQVNPGKTAALKLLRTNAAMENLTSAQTSKLHLYQESMFPPYSVPLLSILTQKVTTRKKKMIWCRTGGQRQVGM